MSASRLESKSGIERFKIVRDEAVALIGVLTSAVAFVVLVRDSMYLAALVLSVVVILVVFAGCAYIIVARIQPVLIGGVRLKRYSKRRRWSAIALCCACGVGVCVILLTTSGRRFLNLALFDVESATTTHYQVGIVQFSKGMLGNAVAFDITVRNASDQPVLIKKLALSGVENYSNALCDSASSLYRIGAEAKLSRCDGRHFILGRVTKDGDEVIRPVRGMLFDTNCSSRDFVLAFDISEIIGSHEYSTLRVTIPSAVPLVDGGRRAKPPLRIATWKNTLVRCVLDRSNTVIAASFGPMPADATDYDGDEFRWLLLEALDHE